MESMLDKALEREVWKTYKAASTPVEIVDFMLEVSGIETWQRLKILEPGCGFLRFLDPNSCKVSSERIRRCRAQSPSL